jgi:anti-sigma factor RsiW
MRCVKVATMLSAYLDGELTPSDAGGVEAHLDGCKACRQRLDSLRRLQDLLAELPAPAVPGGFTLRVVAEVRTGTRFSAPHRARSTVRRYGLPVARAAAMAAVMLLGIYLGVTSATMGSKEEAKAFEDSGQELSAALYAESFDLLPKDSLAAQYLAPLEEKGR